MRTPLAMYGRQFRQFGMALVLGALTLVSGLTGCVTHRSTDKTVTIESDPPGMRIEVNGENLGNTPTTYVAKVNTRGNFAGGWGEYPSVVFTAFPPDGSKDLYKQIKSFNPSGFMDSGDRVPAQIFFDMHSKIGRD